MNSPAPSRKNHYVPVWYQKGFAVGPKLQYLDLNPSEPNQPNARGRPTLRAPKSCFSQEDLYTTVFGSVVNDEIERHLFGAIDNDGANAVRAFARSDLRAIHENFQNFFDYLDAQKLRTPKGLDWIKRNYPELNQVDLMLEMQHLRQMHGTMWYECVREIVSAEASDIKFLVTDHPVTIYNAAFPPSSAECTYPDDPSIGLMGSQTIFALDHNHCSILTNLEHAQDPKNAALAALRTNARFRGQTIARTDSFIRTRKLRREDVAAINYVLKSRARRYIAAGTTEWLFPEDVLPETDWPAFRDVLLPPVDQLSRFGGEIYIGYKDGTTHFQDAFGRTSKVHEYLGRKEPVRIPMANDRCACRSGRKYKKCCMGLDLLSRPRWDVYSMRERNIMLCNAVTEILELNKGKSWEDVRRELSDDQVKEIHTVLQSLWPQDSNVVELLPPPDKRIFRGVFMGVVDPRTLPVSVTAQLAYFDEVFLINPFPNPSFMTPDYSPIASPGQYKSQTLKNVLVLLTLEPFIRAGVVHLVPDPMEISAEFRRALMSAAEKRDVRVELESSDFEIPMRLAKDDSRRALLRMPEDTLERMVLESQPGLSSEVVKATVALMKEQLEDDPFALLQPVKPGPENAELQVSRGIALELAIFLAQLTGSAIYTDSQAHWKQLQLHARRSANAAEQSPWHQVEEAADKVTVAAEVNPQIILDVRRSAKLGYPRAFFRRVTNLVRERTPEADTFAARLSARLNSIAERISQDWAACKSDSGPSHRFDCQMTLSIPTAGFQMNAATRLLLTFGRRCYWPSVCMAFFIRPILTDSRPPSENG